MYKDEVRMMKRLMIKYLGFHGQAHKKALASYTSFLIFNRI